MQFAREKSNTSVRGHRRWKLAQWAEIRWWRRYLAGRSPEEYLAWKRSYWMDFLERLEIDPQAAEQVLDAGCGPAGIFTVLSGQEVTALDPLLDQYLRHLPSFRPETYPYVRFQAGLLEDFHAPASFDLVFCLNAINHVADLERSLHALFQSVRPGGWLILSSDLHNFSWLKHVFRLLPGDILHPQQHDLKDYLGILDRPGWNWKEPVVFKKEAIFSYTIFVGQKVTV